MRLVIWDTIMPIMTSLWCQQRLTSIRTWIGNYSYIHRCQCEVIIHPCPNFNEGLALEILVEVMAWMCNHFPLFYVSTITNKCPNLTEAAIWLIVMKKCNRICILHPGCLLNRLFRRRSKKTPKLRVTGLCEANSPVSDEFPAHKRP